MLVEESTIQFFGCHFYALHDCSYFTLKALYRQVLSKKLIIKLNITLSSNALKSHHLELFSKFTFSRLKLSPIKSNQYSDQSQITY